MKLRVKNNSVRLRLTQAEVARLAENGRVEEAVEFGVQSDQRFVYALEISSETEEIRAKLENNRITIFIPKPQAEGWTQSDRTGMEAAQNIGDGKTLRLLIEKDFACLAPRRGEDDADAFPHPQQGKVC
jgi:hypothetical protein